MRSWSSKLATTLLGVAKEGRKKGMCRERKILHIRNLDLKQNEEKDPSESGTKCLVLYKFKESGKGYKLNYDAEKGLTTWSSRSTFICLCLRRVVDSS